LFILAKEANIYFDVFQYSLGGNEKLCRTTTEVRPG